MTAGGIRRLKSAVAAFSLWALWVSFACAAPAPETRVEEVSFVHGDDRLSGSLVRPDTPGPWPAVVMVHGDGALDRSCLGIYVPLWEAFAARGFAVLSWDKPGVGRSTGDWRSQGMRDRAGEVLAAVRFLESRREIRPDAIGLWGISQAGWVMPSVNRERPLAFMIAVSTAIDGSRQAEYLVRQTLVAEGLSGEIEPALAYLRKVEDLQKRKVPLEEARRQAGEAPAGYRATFGEITQANYGRWLDRPEDEGAMNLENLRKVICPVLAIFGEKDANVDFRETANVYAETFREAGNRDATIMIFPEANHAIMKGTMNDVLASLKRGDPPPYVPGYVECAARWLAERFGKSR